MEDAFLCAKGAVLLLHAKLVELRAKGATPGLSQTSKQHVSRTIAVYLSQLQLIHSAVRIFLLQLAADPAAVSADTKLLQCLKSVAEEVSGLEALENCIPAELATQVRQLRAAKLEADAQALRSTITALPPYIPVQPEALEAVVRSLSHREQSLDFHIRLAAEVSERFGQDTTYSVENFAYGSTPYTSWLQVMTTAGRMLQEAMTSSAPLRREYVVWGSSCGWLVLYGALTFGWRSRGVELLSYMHRVAEQVAGEQAAALTRTAGVRFTCGDLLQDDVSTAGLVVLSDQCWDEHLAAAAGAKLARELPVGALCVSYGSGAAFLRGADGGGGVGGCDGGGATAVGGAGEDGSEMSSSSGTGGVFEEVASVAAPVSWSETQTFRVFRRRL